MCGAEQAKMHGQFAQWGVTNLDIGRVSSRSHLNVRPRGGFHCRARVASLCRESAKSLPLPQQILPGNG